MIVSNNTKIIAIEGLLGVGKSTLIEGIQRTSTPSWRIENLSENIEPSFLDLFYSDPKRYAFAFQYGVMKSRIYQWSLTNVYMSVPPPQKQCSWYLCDRTMIGDYIFAQTNYLCGNITTREMKAYASVFGVTFKTLPESRYLRNMDVIVYLVDTPERCKYRVENVRKNKVESNIPLEYYEKLDQVHFEAISSLWKAGKPVMVLSWPKYRNAQKSKDYIQQYLDGKVKLVSLKRHIRGYHPGGTSAATRYLSDLKDIEKCYTTEVVPSYENKTYPLSPPPPERNWEAVLIRKHTTSKAYRHVVLWYLSRGVPVYYLK